MNLALWGIGGSALFGGGAGGGPSVVVGIVVVGCVCDMLRRCKFVDCDCGGGISTPSSLSCCADRATGRSDGVVGSCCV